MKARLFFLLILVPLVTLGCTTQPVSPTALDGSTFHKLNVVLPDFVRGYPMHY